MRMQFTSIQGPEMSVIFAARWTNEVRLVTGWQGGLFSPPIGQCLTQVDCALYIMYITVTLFVRLKDGHQGHFVNKKSATYNL